MSHITPRFRHDTAGAGRNSLWSEAILAGADWCEKTVIQYRCYVSKRCRQGALCTSQREEGSLSGEGRLSQYQCISLQKGIMHRGTHRKVGSCSVNSLPDPQSPAEHFLAKVPLHQAANLLKWSGPLTDQALSSSGPHALGHITRSTYCQAMGSVTFPSEGRK